MISDRDQEIKQKAEDVELYRKRWLKAEKENDRLRKELDNDH